MKTKWGEIMIVQIAGLVARRIVSFHKVGDALKKGDPLGLIKFGSRVDVWVPAGSVSKVLVKKDDIVKIGSSLIEMK